MTESVPQTDDHVFVKRYPSRALAATAQQRSILAQRHGVSTPPVLGSSGPMALRFARVVVRGQPSLAEMLDVVAWLHLMPQAGLARFDPFRRILPRLGTAPPQIGALTADLAARDAALGRPEAAVIHGDFHPGQVLRDGGGKVWLIDLDDLALAPPEADLGNLAAWLATQSPGGLTGLADSAQKRVLSVAPRADPAMVGHFCEIALVRRALKLAERGQDWVLEQLTLRA
jgi:Phosphotransferase enzyme family